MIGTDRIKLGQELTRKDSWRSLPPAIIAACFGFVDDDNFRRALDDFLKNVVDGARIGDFLPILAANHFRNWHPPLTSVNSNLRQDSDTCLPAGR